MTSAASLQPAENATPSVGQRLRSVQPRLLPYRVAASVLWLLKAHPDRLLVTSESEKAPATHPTCRDRILMLAGPS